MNKTKKWLAHVLTLAMVICSISVLSFGQQAKSEADIRIVSESESEPVCICDGRRLESGKSVGSSK